METPDQSQRWMEPSPSTPSLEESPADEQSDFSFLLVRGDALFRVQRAIGLIPRQGLGVARRALLFAMITWLPIVIWAVLYHRALPGEAAEPLLQHFGIHIRCLVAIPLLIAGEALAQAIVRRLIPQFLRSGLILEKDRARFIAIVVQTAQLRDAYWPWVIVAGLVLGRAVVSPQAWNTHDLVWATDVDASHLRLGFGGWWFLYVARPIFMALLLAWIWRLVLVTILFWRIARLDLALVPTHPDRACGLGFLEGLPLAFSPFVLAWSSVLASRWAHDFLYHEVPVVSMYLPLTVYTVIMLGLLLAPLEVFILPLTGARKRALLEYGALVAAHGRLVRQRWILGERVENEALLQAPELGPVADTVSLYDAITRSRPAPIGTRAVAAILAPILLPVLAAVAVQVPLRDIVIKLVGVLL